MSNLEFREPSVITVQYFPPYAVRVLGRFFPTKESAPSETILTAICFLCGLSDSLSAFMLPILILIFRDMECTGDYPSPPDWDEDLLVDDHYADAPPPSDNNSEWMDIQSEHRDNAGIDDQVRRRRVLRRVGRR